MRRALFLRHTDAPRVHPPLNLTQRPGTNSVGARTTLDCNCFPPALVPSFVHRAMLHQRRRQPEGGAAPPPPVSTSKPSNNAYVPLRRPSGSALPPPPVPGEPNGFDSYNGGSYGHLASGSYHNPSVASAPSLPRVVGQGQGYTPSHGRGMSLGLGGGPFSPAVEFTDDTDASAVGQARRAIEAVRSGVRDAVRLDRSMGLVWG